MKRREFITLLGGAAAAWLLTALGSMSVRPWAVHAQQPVTPVVSYMQLGATQAVLKDSQHKVLLTSVKETGLDSGHNAIASSPVIPLSPKPVPPSGASPSVQIALEKSSSQPLTLTQERSLKPKDSFKECETCPEMMVVPPGIFSMGSPEKEQGRDTYEGPQHRVSIARSFAVSKYEVTVDQFAMFANESNFVTASDCFTLENDAGDFRPNRSWRNRGYYQTGSHPVACLDWEAAKAYVAWLSKYTGKAYRLLTEGEWEYVARAGKTTRYFFGDRDQDFCRYGNGLDQTAKRNLIGAANWPTLPCRDGYTYTAPVGSFLANDFGLHDMLGNVSEWTEDCWHEGYPGAPSDGSAWITRDCTARMFRGGSWYDNIKFLRVAARNGGTLQFRSLSMGFRVGRTLAP